MRNMFQMEQESLKSVRLSKTRAPIYIHSAMEQCVIVTMNIIGMEHIAVF